MAVSKRTTTRLRSKLLAMIVVIDWKKLLENLDQIGSVRKIRGRLDIARLVVFEAGNMLSMAVRSWSRGKYPPRRE